MSAVVTLKKGEGRLLKAGGMWVYDNETASITGEFENGDIVTVHDYDGFLLGRGFINEHSKIRIRMMTRNAKQEIDRDFIRMRVKHAWEYRKRTVETDSCRLVFGEADFLPGIVIDKFSDVLVVESLALGIDRMKGMILEAVTEVLAGDGIRIRGIYERSDAKVREQEGMQRYKGFIGPEFDTNVQIEENGIKYIVDVQNGQKTGFFLDQKYNRRAAGRLCRDARVLDCFTNTGSFALNAAAAGAESVLGVDASDTGRREQMETTKELLSGLQVSGIPVITVYNKADCCEGMAYPKIQGEDRIYISAKDGASIQALVQMITAKLYENYILAEFQIPYDKGEILSYFMENAHVLEKRFEETGTWIQARCHKADLDKYRQYVM